MKNSMELKTVLIFLLALMTLLAPAVEDDQNSCADEVQDMESCIPFVSIGGDGGGGGGGGGGTPTPGCCEDLESVLTRKPVCLCFLIKESADPSMSLPINTTLALSLPALCHNTAKVSNCPRLLKVPPDSPEARIFQDAGRRSTEAHNSHSGTPTSGSKSAPRSEVRRKMKDCVSWLFTGSMLLAAVYLA